ncbi:transferase [Desulfobulbus rhabdoformis]|jgi:carbonic anhydrase/acetyltransferase-like protein (isoleucine patch superfamily)|uniref:transferase n=1 Tax=Desulfobulbus rhabdoformis TaxID=34032 RepID=UPI001962ED3D|nr:transferase [Desulfobulbus rhabdoformis]MBM9613481.1 transferase [Desulfobulbus rhabdoformis]
MFEREKIFNRIIQRVNINLRDLNFDVSPFVTGHADLRQMSRFYAFYGVTTDIPLNLQFIHSSLAGSYFLGKCQVKNAMLYKTDIRGDELKRKGSTFQFKNFSIDLRQDEFIDIVSSALVKTLVHNFSHDPESPERFFIKNTLSLDYANIHGAPADGCFLSPFATVDLTTMRNCAIGAYSYIQAGRISHLNVQPGTIWVNSPGTFNFLYQFPQDRLQHYIKQEAGGKPEGALIDFIEKRAQAFDKVFDTAITSPPIPVPETASLDRYAVVLSETTIDENVLVAQRAYLENCTMGIGANAQENCYIINSNLQGNNVMAHGAKVVETEMEKNIFVGFNSFLVGKPGCRITIGTGCIVMPHTIIDCSEPLEIPPDTLLWGLITNKQELEENSIPLEELRVVHHSIQRGNMHFEGEGGAFVEGFKHRINHILESNGAFYHQHNNNIKGHAQNNRKLSLNNIQPYLFGEMEGVYPDITIQPQG